MKFTRKAQLALTAIAAAAPLALALPAQASTTTGLCTVTPGHRPSITSTAPARR